MHLDLDLEIPFHMAGLTSGYFLLMETMSLDGLWDCDEASPDDGQY